VRKSTLGSTNIKDRHSKSVHVRTDYTSNLIG